MIEQLSKQDQASLAGARTLKQPGSELWCWQTISHLQSMWKSLNLDFGMYMKAWQEAEEQAIWEKIPADRPFGTKAEMLKALEIGDDVAARARVAVQAIPARPLNQNGGVRKKGEQYDAHRTALGSTGADYLTARIARDRPDIWERMKRGEFTSVAAAARAAGILKSRPKSIGLIGDTGRVAANIKKHYTEEQVRALKDAL